MNVIFWNSMLGSMGEQLNVPSRYIGPYKIKHWIQKHGYQGQVLDYITNFTQEQLYNATKKFITSDTMVIALSSTFTLAIGLNKWSDGTYSPFPETIIQVARQIKREFPRIKFVIGGYGSEHVYGGDTFEACIMSYTEASEDIFVEYLDYLKTGTNPPFSKLLTKFYHLTPGWLQKNKVVPRLHYYQARTKKYNIEVDDFKFTKQDAVLPGETLPLDISRGCIFACRFCNYPHLGKSKTDYIRGMEYVKEELLYNYRNFGTTNYMVLDDTFNETQTKMDAFHRMTETLPFKINYTAYLRADLIERFPDTAHMLKDSGLWGAFHGIETMHPESSKLVGKGWSGTPAAKEFIPKLYHDMWKAEVPQLLNYIVGWPKETLRDVMNTLEWFKDNNLYSIAYERLSLSDPKKSHRYSIMNEFEKNSEKYGFTFVDSDKMNARSEWYNETWNSLSLTHARAKIYKYIDSNKFRKVSIWNLGNMQLLGYDKQYLMTTYKGDFDLILFDARVKKMLDDYYKLLMDI